MPKKRANGEGNIRKRKDGRWEGRYTAGYDPNTGKRINKNVLGKTQAEAREKLKKAMEECQGLDIARRDEYTVATWAPHSLRRSHARSTQSTPVALAHNTSAS